jgi:SAM-dependent methyltransferase
MQEKKPALRPDYKAVQAFYKDRRSEERLRVHYDLERQLACRLRDAPAADRAKVYNDVYCDIFRALPDHPQAVEKNGDRARHVSRLLARLMPLLGKDKNFLEIGCGDGALSSAVAPHVAHGYALDVTDVLVDPATVPTNMELLITAGGAIPLPDSSIDVALSDQLIEHLHPDDVPGQLLEIFRVLKPGGAYYCCTPNRVIGPHDVSCFFEYEASGFHLCEYDSRAILRLFNETGFRRSRFFVPVGGSKVPLASIILRTLENALLSMPCRARAWTARRRLIGVLVGLNVIATK